MGESVYKIIELVGVSTESWEKAAKSAVETAARLCTTCGLQKSSSWTCNWRIMRW